MSLPNLVTAYADFISEAVEDATGKEVGRALRYHGGPIPDDWCCEDGGIVSAWTANVHATIDFPNALIFKGKLQGAYQLIELGAKWSTCWKIADLDPDNKPIEAFETWDAAAASLETVAEVVTKQLMELTCRSENGAGREVLENTGCGLFRFADCKPNEMVRSGGCAGWTWRSVAGLESRTLS